MKQQRRGDEGKSERHAADAREDGADDEDDDVDRLLTRRAGDAELDTTRGWSARSVCGLGSVRIL